MTLTPVICTLRTVQPQLFLQRCGCIPELKGDAEQEAAQVALVHEQLLPCVARLLLLDPDLLEDLAVLCDDFEFVTNQRWRP